MAEQTPLTPLPQPVPLKYARDTKRLYSRGVNFNNPVDSIPEGYYPILENIRQYTDGILQPRQGITQVAASVIASQTPVHSVRRLNNTLNSTYTRVVGVGTKLAYGQGSFSTAQYNAVDLAFSGKPLAMTPWRPEQSPVSWMYVADSTAMYKLTYNGSAATVHKIGVAAPTAAPTVELAVPSIIGQPVTGSIFTSAGSWAATPLDGSTIAGAPVHADRVTGVTVTKIIYDSGTTGWACLVPSSTANLGPGTILNTLTALNTEYCMIWEMYRPSSTTGTTIATILYDNNPTNTGNCTISPTSSISQLKRNSVVLLNADTTNGYARVTEVITGPDNSIIAFRCSTGSTTFSAGQTLVVKASCRIYSTTALDTTTTIQADSMQTTFTATATAFRGAITYTPASDLDLTVATGHAVTDDDYFHVSFKAADVSQIVGGRIMFDIDDTSFTKNAFYRSFTPSDLIAAAKATQTILESGTTQIQNTQITIPTFAHFGQDNPSGSRTIAAPPGTTFTTTGPPRDVTGTGDSQWSEIRFHRGDCQRIGTDWSRGWHAVKRIRLELTMISGAAVTLMEWSSFSIFGGATPDVGDIGAAFRYRYRYRSTVTGACSNWSPATRDGVWSLRTGIKVSPTASSAPEIDVIDYQRWGGLVSAWADIGVSVNAGFLTDTSGDDTASSTLPDSVDDINYQPWLIAQSPKTGTATTLAGTLIKDNSTSFSTSWAKGTGLKINGFQTTIRRVLSTSLLEVEDCVGSGTTLTWEIPEPFIAGVALPCFWGPANGWFFACGDATNPGRLYFSSQNNPDSTQQEYFIEVTAPSEPLQNGCVYNGRPYVFSSERLFEIVEIGPGQFITREAPTGKGLMYRWGFCVGPKIWFLSKDGLYETDGGVAQSITYNQLHPLFPKEGTLGIAVNGFNPPNVTTGNITVSGITADASTFFRLSYYDGYVYFDYPDTNNRLRTLTYTLGSFAFDPANTQTGWYPDVFNPGGTNTGITYHYGEEGDGVHNLLICGADTTTGKLYSYGGSDDNGTAISWHVRQASWDAGDRRADKVFGDFIVDADAGGGTINVAAGINNYGSTLVLSSSTLTGSGRTQKTFDISSGNGAEAKNLAIDLSGTGTAARLYLIEPSFSLRPEDTLLRAIQYDDAGYQGEKFFQAIEIEADTQNAVRTVRVEYDGGQLGDTLSVQHNGRLQKPYSFTSGFVGHLARLIPTDANLWKLFRWHWVYEPEPPLVTVWDTQQTTFGHVGYVHLKAIWITHTSTADLTLTITRMDDNTSRSFTVPHSAGVRGVESYILLGPPEFLKGKSYKFKITQTNNTPFRIYQRNSGVLVKPWASAQAFARWVGWGGDAGDGVAQY